MIRILFNFVYFRWAQQLIQEVHDLRAEVRRMQASNPVADPPEEGQVQRRRPSMIEVSILSLFEVRNQF